MGKRLRVVEMACVIAGFVLFGTSWVMSFWLWRAMPTQADVAGGFIVPMITHGRTVYLTRFCDIVNHALFGGGLALFFCAVLIDARKNPFNRRTMRR